MQIVRRTGHPRQWSRDLGLIGGVTSLAAPSMAVVAGLAPIAYAPIAGIIGASTGAAIGMVMPALLDLCRRRIPIPILWVLGVVLGGCWGAVVGLFAAALVTPQLLLVSVFAAMVGGAMQFGGVWFPYAFQTVRRGRTWPVVLSACLASPGIGVACIVVTLLSLGLA